ncbi:hypothetical protein RFM26_05945 [Mesorhizobium sp. VK23B]|uniref:Uncharacterized protein n=1 Tax=Mesorhizobium dulcispinae TaxID=3072316 RepID=A0ABU4XEU4_9HYPH|nr:MULTISPECIES: hypothetical protein [unclassified Mesorhizobium]MDX8465222.1 hypothetical protein [Mesorhizobium sp. VK23B]MDX8473134.1 hypothetical protein [Mesorhizobium sp. VK23A]
MSVSAPDPLSTLIAATRNDGLGGRLLAMANAKTLADTFGYRFGFTWNRKVVADKAFHVVDVADRIFSPDFIERHWLGERVKASKFGILDAAALAGRSLGEVAKEKKLRGWICDDFQILRHFRGDEARLVAQSETLRSFDFSRTVKEAIDAANQSRFLQPMAALHLRSGDIVHGKHRATLIFAGKVIPSTLARAVISRLSSMGMPTLLIGQHRPTLDYLKAETGAVLASDFGADAFEDETLKAFFEMALMARCRQIYSGSSIYAEIASLMGDVPLMRAAALFDAPRAAEIVLDELKHRQANYHPLEAAFGYQAAFLAMEDRIEPRQAREILDKAYALDPENDAYALKIASACFRERDYASGEAVLKSVMIRQFRQRPKIPLTIMRLLGDELFRRYPFAGDFEFFFAAAEAGYPYAAACSAWILQQAKADQGRALAMADRAVKADPSDQILRKVKRRILQGKRPSSGLITKARWRIAWLRGLGAA